MIVRNDLGAVATVIDLPRRTRKVVVQNLAFASIVIVVLVGIDRFATLPLPLGVAGHETSTATVGLRPRVRGTRGAVGVHRVPDDTNSGATPREMMMAEALRDLLYGRELTEALMAEDLERATLDSPS